MIRRAFAHSVGTAFVLFVAVGCTDPTQPVLDARPVQQGLGPARNLNGLPLTAPILVDQASSTVFGTLFSPGLRLGDDFVVPAGQTWTVKELAFGGIVTGALTFEFRSNVEIPSGCGFAQVPGDVLPGASFTLTATATTGVGCPCLFNNYLYELPTPLVLPAGTYWLTVGPNSSDTGNLWWQDALPAGAVTVSSADGIAWVRSSRADLGHAFVLSGTAAQSQSINFPAITPNPASVGSSATLAATASSLLAVNYTSKTPQVCTVDATTTSFVGAGTCIVAANQPGNTTYAPADEKTQSVEVKSVYVFGGFQAPVDPTKLNSAKGGSAVPVKFSLGGDRGLSILATGSPTSKAAACPSSTPLTTVDESVATSAGGGGLSYDPATGIYTYVWKTEKAWAGTCRTFVLTLADGTEYSANFQFKK